MEQSEEPKCNNTENDETESNSSMSIIMEDELDEVTDKSEQLPPDYNTCVENKDFLGEKGKDHNDQSEDSEDSFSAMTRSQYAQVVFHDIADSYPNDTDIIISFTLTSNVPIAQEAAANDKSSSNISYGKKISGDRIGIFKVPFVSPSDILAFEWVTETDCTNEGSIKDVGTVIFKGCDIPKEEDFFQFQYLRVSEDATQNVLGASIPFQLRKPKNEELCAVQNDSEFMVVQTTTALASGQFSEKMGSLEAEKTRLYESLNRTTHDYSRLLELSENLTEQLDDKSLSFIELEKDYRIRKSDLDQAKADLACVIQDKLLLEERLQKNVECSKSLQTKVDDLYGKCQTKDQEINLLQESQESLIAKLEDTKQLLAVTTKSKDEATHLLKSHIVRADNLQKEVELLKQNLSDKEVEDNMREQLHLLKITSQQNSVPTSVVEEIASSAAIEQAQPDEETGKLICPICSLEDERTPGNVRNLELHVNEHLEGLKCPMCSIAFDANSQNAYENHVNAHFNDANDFVEVEGQNQPPAVPVTDNPDNEQREEPRFWFVDNID